MHLEQWKLELLILLLEALPYLIAAVPVLFLVLLWSFWRKRTPKMETEPLERTFHLRRPDGGYDRVEIETLRMGDVVRVHDPREGDLGEWRLARDASDSWFVGEKVR